MCQCHLKTTWIIYLPPPPTLSNNIIRFPTTSWSSLTLKPSHIHHSSHTPLNAGLFLQKFLTQNKHTVYLWDNYYCSCPLICLDFEMSNNKLTLLRNSKSLTISNMHSNATLYRHMTNLQFLRGKNHSQMTRDRVSFMPYAEPVPRNPSLFF